MRFFPLLAFCSQLFASPFEHIEPSTPEEIQSLQSGLVIEGYVSALSGQFLLSEEDLRIRGAQDLTLKRIYIAPQIQGRYDKNDKVDRLELGKALAQLQTKGWVVYPHLWAGYNRNSRNFQVRDPSGFTLEFAIQGTQGRLQTASFGMSNLQGDMPSSSFDLRNISFVVDGNLIKIKGANGITREYGKQNAMFWRLERELLPNGKVIRYEYGARGELHKVISCDRSGKYTYATITKSGHDYLGSDGTRASLLYETQQIKGSRKENNHSEKISVSFPVMIKSSHPSFQNTVGYNERTLLTAYEAKDYPVSCSYDLKKNTHVRIETFSTPSGSVSFGYDPAIPGKKKCSTTVTYPDGAKVIYRFNEQLLLEAIENWNGARLINQKCYAYDHKQHVKSIETKDERGQILIAKRFECDQAGNPILEVTQGDVGTFSIRREFNQNRLTRECHEDGLEYRYAYLEDTHLPISKEILASGQLLRKTVHVYDEACNLIETQEVGKTRTRYTLHESGPHLHRIRVQEERDWNDHLIHRIEYSIDPWGNLGEERHFDADGNFAYAIERTYNEKGELLNETNALGDRAFYQYDDRGRCVYERPISNGLVIERRFDEKGRLVSLRKNEHETTFRYNASDELIENTDYLGYTTHYNYDPVHGKPTQIQKPTGITSIRYDAWGREAERIDPLGAKTETFHNSDGKIAKIIDPEGGEEHFEYYPNGLIKRHSDPDGVSTTYAYDPIRRIVEKKVGSHRATYRYDAYNLIQDTDSAGYITEYEYDLQNRLTVKKREGRVTRYRYDPLGFLAREERGERYIAYTNDLLGKIITKSIDGLLNTSWEYDPAGNITKMQQGDAISTFTYDAHNRMICSVDAEGNQTSVQYKIGPQVLVEIATDPIGTQIVKTYNPQGSLLKKEVSGVVVEEFEYDALHRLKRQDHLTFEYTPNGQKSLMREADKRMTLWTYTLAKRLKAEQKSDGSMLACSYDKQGRLTKKGSREFSYDSLGRLIGGTHFQRILDPFGNILREEWVNGLWIESEYDDWDRPLVRCLPDRSKVIYTYEGPLLKSIARINSKDKSIYVHRFDQYDARGNAQQEEGFFSSSFQYDKIGRRIEQQSLYHTESVRYDPAGRMIQRNEVSYGYDGRSQMTSESGQFTASYDVRYNLTQLNGNSIEIDPLNQIRDLRYDLNGNLLRDGFTYDELGQLVQAGGEQYIYDALGRRIQKGNSCFLYIGDEEVGYFENGICAELKVGEKSPIAIEIRGLPFAPIVDVQGTIRKLVDPRSGIIVQENHCDAFGKGLSAIPYAYSGKRYDAETGFVYFGHRFYDPNLRRWLTPDPSGPIDHSNLYQYVYNNPYLYRDLRGESIGGYLLGLGEIVFGGTLIVTGGILEFVTLGGYTIGCGFQVGAGMALIGHGISMTTHHAQDISFSSDSEKFHNFDLVEKKHTPDQSALSDLVKGSGKKGVSQTDADTLLDWAKEYEFPHRDDRDKDHWVGGEHIHIGPKHVPVQVKK